MSRLPKTAVPSPVIAEEKSENIQLEISSRNGHFWPIFYEKLFLKASHIPHMLRF